MTPGARIAAAIALLDEIAAGTPPEQALTRWARASRFAGSGDRAAVRDHVFDALRCWRSCAALGGAESGRGRMLGLLRAQGADPAALFTGVGHAPPPLSAQEEAAGLAPADLPELVALDFPDWLAPALRADLGARFAPVMAALRHRAPVFLRANLARTTREGAAAALEAEGVRTAPHPLSPAALEVLEGARRVQQGETYSAGLVELQDAASQAVADMVPLAPGQRVLDFCAGGGGKALALAAREPAAQVFAHDVAPARLRDLPARAERASARITVVEGAQLAAEAPFEVVVCDAPCSGSGAWRRAPWGKWALTPERLASLCATQRDILETAAGLVAPGGHLAYFTCSLLDAENEAPLRAFLAAHPGWECTARRSLTPLDGADGFFAAIVQRRR